MSIRAGVERLITVSGGAGDPSIESGTLDPTATPLDRPEGSFYMRFVAGAGEVYYKFGAATTAWRRLSANSGIYSPPEKWDQQNVAAAQTDVDLSALVSTSFDTIQAIRAGSIVGLSTRFTEAITDATASSAVVTVTINGAAGTLALAHSSGVNPSGGQATQLPGVDTYVAGDLLGVQITTLGTFAPTTTDVEAWIEVIS